MAYNNSTSNTGALGTTPSVTVPSGLLTNDVVILVLTVDSTSALPALPAGFTSFGASSSLTFDGETSQVAWKRFAGETGSYTWGGAASGGGWIAAVAAWSGRDTSSAPTASPVSKNNSANSSPAFPLVPAMGAIAGDDLLYVAVVDPTGSATGFTAPSGFTSRVGVGGSFQGMSVCSSENLSTTGTTGSVNGTASATSSMAWQAWLIRIPKVGVAGLNYAGVGTDLGGGVGSPNPWSNVSNIVGAPDATYAQWTV